VAVVVVAIAANVAAATVTVGAIAVGAAEEVAAAVTGAVSARRGPPRLPRPHPLPVLIRSD